MATPAPQPGQLPAGGAQANKANTAPAILQPNVSSSALRPMTEAEVSKIQGGRDANRTVSTSTPQLLSNPQTQTAPTGVDQQVAPTGSGAQQVAPTSGNQAPVAVPPPAGTPPPAQPSGPQPAATPGMTQQEKDAVLSTMGSFTDTLAGYGKTMQDTFNTWAKGMQPQAPAAQAPGQAAVPGTMGNGQMTPNPRDQGIPAEPLLNVPQHSSFDLLQNQLAQNTPAAKTASQSQMITPPAGNTGIKKPQAATLASDILNDPVASTTIAPGDDPYTSNVKDMMSKVMANIEGTDGIDQSMNALITSMNKQKESAAAGAVEANDIAIRDANALKDRTQHDEETMLEDIKYEAGKGIRTKQANIDRIQEENGRVFGFIQEKLRQMGSPNGSFAMAQVAKYTSLATAQLNDANNDLVDYQHMMAVKSRDIMYKSGQQLMDIENQKNDTIQKNTRMAFDQINQINGQIAQTTLQKTQYKNDILMKMSDMTRQAQSQADAKIAQTRQAALDEAKFTWQKINDVQANARADKQLQNQVDQFKETMDFSKDEKMTTATGLLYIGGEIALDPVSKEPIKTIAGKTYADSVDQWYTQTMGTLYKNGQDTGKLTAAYQQFKDSQTGNFTDPITGERMRSISGQTLDNQTINARVELAAKEKAGTVPPGTLAEFDRANGIESAGPAGGTSNTQISIGGQNTPVDSILAQAKQAAAANYGNNGWDCVEYARALAPGLPHGLFTLKDSVDKLLTNNPNQVQPQNIQPLDSIVMNMGGNHIATVKSVNGDGTMTITENNVKKDAKGHPIVSERTIPITGGQVVGFWRDPSHKPANVLPGVANKIGTDFTNFLANPFNMKGADKAAATTNAPSGPAQDFNNKVLKVSSMIPTENQRDAFNAVIPQLLKQGENVAQQYVGQFQYSQYPKAVQDKFDVAESGIHNIDTALEAVDGADANLSGVYQKAIQDNVKWANMGQNPQYADLQSKMSLATADVIHQFYAGNLSQGELERAGAFSPKPDDNIATVKTKLMNLRSYLRSIQGNTGKDHVNSDGYKINASGMVNVQDSKTGEIIEVDPSVLRDQQLDPSIHIMY